MIQFEWLVIQQKLQRRCFIKKYTNNKKGIFLLWFLLTSHSTMMNKGIFGFHLVMPGIEHG
jgi:hypothetical protein